MTSSSKTFLKQLFSLQKTLRVKNRPFSEMVGKHPDTLKNWKARKTKPSEADIARVCHRLSKEQGRRATDIRRRTDQNAAIDQFIVSIIDNGFTSKKVSR